MCLGTAIFAGGRIRATSKNHCVRVADARRTGLCCDGQRARSCARNRPAAVSGRRTAVLQLGLHDPQSHAKASGGIPATALPTFSHEGDFNFTWGFYRDFDLTVLVPVVTNHYEMAGAPTVGGTGLGDAMVLVKYRFYRRDSPRGTTQASVTVGPKIPTGRTDLTGTNGSLLPAGLQPGSGSTDLFLAANWTYTGLFNLKRLVADEDFHSLIRTEGTQATRLGSDIESRFWLSYRPYESKDGAREWFIGPVLTWLYSQDESIAGVTQQGSGGNALLAGVTTYVGRAPGNARLARNGLGRCAFHRADVHARSQPHQFRDHATVSDAPLRKGGTMNRKNFALLILLGMMVGPMAQAQIKHIEMRVEGMT